MPDGLLQNKINIWKTEGMLELSSWSEHTFTAMENPLPSPQNAFSHTPALAHETTAPMTPCELLPALQGLRGWSGWAVPMHTLPVQGFTQLQLGSFGVLTLNAAQWQEASPLVTRPEFSLCSLWWEHPFLSAVQRLSDKQGRALSVRSSILSHGWISAGTGTRPVLTTSFVLKK